MFRIGMRTSINIGASRLNPPESISVLLEVLIAIVSLLLLDPIFFITLHLLQALRPCVKRRKHVPGNASLTSLNVD